jgi:hypothetical protein
MLAATPALQARARLGLWIIIASNALFAITDLRLAGGQLGGVYGLKLLQVGVAAIGLAVLRRPRPRAVVLASVLMAAANTCALVAVSGAVTGDDATTLILCIAFAWGTATLLPIGMVVQGVIASICGLAIVFNVYLVHGDLAPALGYASVAVGAGARHLGATRARVHRPAACVAARGGRTAGGREGAAAQRRGPAVAVR